jgi:hypothetical protein
LLILVSSDALQMHVEWSFVLKAWIIVDASDLALWFAELLGSKVLSCIGSTRDDSPALFITWKGLGRADKSRVALVVARRSC